MNAVEEIRVDDFYLPLPKQDDLHRSRSHKLLGIGGFGSGKSFFLLGEALYVTLEFPGSSALLLRKKFPELERGLILDFKNIVPRELYTYNDTKHIATMCNGSRIFFGFCPTGSEKDLSAYLSSAFEWIGIDELGQFSYPAWMFLSGRNRIGSGTKANERGEMPICRMGGATNPMGPGYGWIRSLWVKHEPVTQLGKLERRHDGKYWDGDICVYDPREYHYVHSTVFDNPFQLQKDPGYISRLQAMDPAMRQKALYGDLESVSGQYFSNFAFERHIIARNEERERIEWQAWQPRWISIDWGLAHHTSVHWHTRAQVKGMDGQFRNRVVTYRELVVNETNYDDLCEMIASRTPESEREQLRHIFLSPERFNRVGDTQHTIASEMSEHLKRLGLPACTRANDRRVDGAVFLYNLLETDAWCILETCPEVISMLETRVHDSDKNIEDVLKVDDLGDDVYDDVRYGLLSMLKEKGKPEDVIIAEKIAAIPDHTARVLYSYKQKVQREERAKPVVPRFAPRWMINR